MLRTRYRGRGMALALLLVLTCRPGRAGASPAASAAPTAAATSGAAAASRRRGPGCRRAARSNWDRLKEAAKGEGGSSSPGRASRPAQRGRARLRRAHGIRRTGAWAAMLSSPAWSGRHTRGAPRGREPRRVHRVLDDGRARPARGRHHGAGRPGVLNRPLAGRQVKYFEPSPNIPKDYYVRAPGRRVGDDRPVREPRRRPATPSVVEGLAKARVPGEDRRLRPSPLGTGPAADRLPQPLFGEQYITDLYVGQQVVLSTDNRQLAEWVARGTYPIGIALVQAAVEPMRAEGLPLERVLSGRRPGHADQRLRDGHEDQGRAQPQCGRAVRQLVRVEARARRSGSAR